MIADLLLKNLWWVGDVSNFLVCLTCHVECFSFVRFWFQIMYVQETWFSFGISSFDRRDDFFLPWRKHSYSPTPIILPSVCCECKWWKICACTLLSTGVLVCWVVTVLSSPESLTVSELVSRPFTTCFSNSTTFLANMLLSSSYFSASCTAMFDLRRRHAFSSRNWAVCNNQLQTHKSITWALDFNLAWLGITGFESYVHGFPGVFEECFPHKRNIMHDEKEVCDKLSLLTKEGISWDRKCTSFLGIHSPSKKCTTTMSRQISSKKCTRIYELGLFIMPAEFR